MKVVALLLVVAVIGAFADDSSSGPPPFVCTDNAFVCKFKEIGHHIKYHASKLGKNLADVGTAVVGSALDQGKDLLANGAQAVLGTVLEHLNKEGLVGKREMSFFNKIREHVSNGVDMLKKAKEALHSAFEKAVMKITGMMGDMTGVKKIEDDADKKIDGAVEEFNKEGKKGFLAMAATVAKKLQSIFAEGMAKIKAMYAKKMGMDKRAILGFDSLTDAWNKAKQHLSGVAGSIADTFKPHLESLKKGVSTLADKAKEHAGNLADAAKESFNTLKSKLGDHVNQLQKHVGTLGGHASNAVNALKEAVASIALQAIANAKGTVGDIAKTGAVAAGVVKDHVSDVVTGY